MPFRLVKVTGGYFVETISTGRRHSEKPIPKTKAEAQLRLLQSLPERGKKK